MNSSEKYSPSNSQGKSYTKNKSFYKKDSSSKINSNKIKYTKSFHKQKSSFISAPKNTLSTKKAHITNSLFNHTLEKKNSGVINFPDSGRTLKINNVTNDSIDLPFINKDKKSTGIRDSPFKDDSSGEIKKSRNFLQNFG